MLASGPAVVVAAAGLAVGSAGLERARGSSAPRERTKRRRRVGVVRRAIEETEGTTDEVDGINEASDAAIHRIRNGMNRTSDCRLLDYTSR